MQLFSVTGKVISVSDKTQSFPIKNKDGVPTGQKQDHRIVEIQAMAISKDGKEFAPFSVVAFDPADGFKVPREGDDYAVPYPPRSVDFQQFPKFNV